MKHTKNQDNCNNGCGRATTYQSFFDHVIGGLVLKALAVMMFGTAGILFFFADLPGMTALIVILTATGIFWVPELIGQLLVGTVFLQNKIADIFVRW